MGTLPEVCFKLAWQFYRVGDVIRPSGMLRGWLVANGYVDVLPAHVAPVPPTPSPVSVAATVTEPEPRPQREASWQGKGKKR